MSRIGNSPIKVPEGVSINLQDNKIIISGKLGSLELNFYDNYIKYSEFFLLVLFCFCV